VIRYANIKDSERIIDFIKNHWKFDHIFTQDKNLFEYMYLDKNNLNFVLSETKNGSILSILGFIKYSSVLRPNIFLALLKSVSKKNDGLKCLEFLINKKFNSISCAGIAPEVKNYYKFFNFEVGVMKKFIIINPKFSDANNFKILKIKSNSFTQPTVDNNNFKIVLIRTLKQLTSTYSSLSNELPLSNSINKSLDFFLKKYFYNPYYKYIFYKIKTPSGRFSSIIVMRVFKHAENSCLRIIDVIGNVKNLSNVYYPLLDILEKSNHEYLDCLIGGNDTSFFNHSGFIDVDKLDIVAPEYFEPFLREKKEIHYCSNSSYPYYIFRGDGDQDRPNILKKFDE